MASKRRTIGRLAEEAGVGVETIRFYQRRGLLSRPPAPAGSGYRHYDDSAVLLIRYIRIAQRLGFTLKDIERLKAQLDDSPNFCAAVRRTVESKLDDTRREIAALERLEAELAAFLAACKARPEEKPCPILTELHAVPRGVQP